MKKFWLIIILGCICTSPVLALNSIENKCFNNDSKCLEQSANKLESPQIINNISDENIYGQTSFSKELENIFKLKGLNNFDTLNKQISSFCKLHTAKIERNGEVNTLNNATKKEFKKAVESYNYFLTHRSETKVNFDNYEQIKQWEQEYTEILIGVNALLKDNFNKYYSNKTFPVNTYEEYKTYAKINVPYFKEFSKYMADFTYYRNKYKEYADNIYKYSANLERNQRLKLPQTIGYKMSDFSIEQFIRASEIRFNGKNIYPLYMTNDLTGYDVVIPFTVIQSIKSGILINYRTIDFLTNQTIFLKTNRQYADNDIIRNQLYLIPTGYFSYISTSGTIKKIRQFKEINPKNYLYYFVKK